MARGPHRQRALHEPAVWMRTCHDCHQGELDSMPIVRQLAYKLIHDPEHYDRVAVNLLRHRQPSAITEVEVFLEALDVLSRRMPEGES